MGTERYSPARFVQVLCTQACCVGRLCTTLATTLLTLGLSDYTCWAFCCWWAGPASVLGASFALRGRLGLGCQVVDILVISSLVSWHCRFSINTFCNCDLRSGQIMIHYATYRNLTTFWSDFCCRCLHPAVSKSWLRLDYDMFVIFVTCICRGRHGFSYIDWGRNIFFDRFDLLCVH